MGLGSVSLLFLPSGQGWVDLPRTRDTPMLWASLGGSSQGWGRTGGVDKAGWVFPGLGAHQCCGEGWVDLPRAGDALMRWARLDGCFQDWGHTGVLGKAGCIFPGLGMHQCGGQGWVDLPRTGDAPVWWARLGGSSQGWRRTSEVGKAGWNFLGLGTHQCGGQGWVDLPRAGDAPVCCSPLQLLLGVLTVQSSSRLRQLAGALHSRALGSQVGKLLQPRWCCLADAFIPTFALG